MQEYVQKSTRTTLPFSSSRVSGGEFSHFTAPSKLGNVPSCPSSIVPDGAVAVPGAVEYATGRKRSNNLCSTPDVLDSESLRRTPVSRSEERRVGKECRYRGPGYHD